MIRAIANWISLVLSAPLFALYLLLIILVNEAEISELFLIKFFAGFMFLAFLPITPIVIATKKGETDIFVFDRSKRFKFFLIAITSYLLGAYFFILMNDYNLFLFLLCYATVTSAITVSTLFTKTSVHTAGIAGPITYMVLVFGSRYIPLYALLVPVAWARWVDQAHSIKQLLLGILISVLVTVATILLLS